MGVVYLGFYQYGAGKSGQTPSQWPGESTLVRSDGKPTLVVFIHPKCPCSRASLGELERVLNTCRGKIDAHIVLVQPEGVTDAESWRTTDLCRTAEQLPDANVYFDVDGRESERFSALTSGQAALYGTNGKLLFQGGITSSRGHRGENAGCSAITDLVLGRATPVNRTPVYGCGLRSDGENEREQGTDKPAEIERAP